MKNDESTTDELTLVASAVHRPSAAHMARARAVLPPHGSTSVARLRERQVVFARAEGARLIDLEGRSFVDYVLAFGPVLLGHGDARVVEAVERQLHQAVAYGAQHVGEAELAEALIRLVPCAEATLLCTSGSEAVHAAVRVARATTGRRLVVKFEGHYHGWIDPVFVNSPGAAPRDAVDGVVPTVRMCEGQADASGILVCKFGDAAALAQVLERHASEVAAVLMEPIPCNLGTFIPEPTYMAAVRGLCDQHGALLIFDEVLSGFRMALGGAQELLGVTPDLAVLGKAVASGFPLSAVVGSRDAMASVLAGTVRHGGTYNGSPISVAAALATLEVLEADPGIYNRLDDLGRKLAAGLREAAKSVEAPIAVQQVGSVLQVLWAPVRPVRSYSDAAAADAEPVAWLAEQLLDDGIFAAPRGVMFLSAMHTEADVAQTIDAYGRALSSLEQQGSGRAGTPSSRPASKEIS